MSRAMSEFLADVSLSLISVIRLSHNGAALSRRYKAKFNARSDQPARRLATVDLTAVYGVDAGMEPLLRNVARGRRH